MRKVVLTMEEEKKYKIIKNLLETNGNKRRASVELDCSLRHVNRMLLGYQENEKDFFVHGNRNRKPIHSFLEGFKNQIIDLYTSKYWDCNYRHFTQLLKTHESITISESAIRTILAEEYLISPKAHRSTKRRAKRELQQLKDRSLIKKDIAKIQANIVAIEDAHPRQPRCAYFGEEIQLDASLHLWFGNSKATLHIAIDDSTGQIVGAYFDYQETLKGYYHITHQILTNCGIPYLFKADRRTVFKYKKKSSPSDEEDTFTQFSYACSQLGIAIETSSVPQSKPRVERVFQTLQSRLPVELRLADITSIDDANTFLVNYIKKFNEQFALCVNHTKSVFELQPNEENINLILSVLSQRTVDSGHSIKYHNKFYETLNKNGNNIFYAKGTKCMVIKTLNNELYASVNEEIYMLHEIPAIQAESPNFDSIVDIKPIKRKIPAMNHPWRKKSFEDFIAKQEHRMKKKTA